MEFFTIFMHTINLKYLSRNNLIHCAVVLCWTMMIVWPEVMYDAAEI